MNDIFIFRKCSGAHEEKDFSCFENNGRLMQAERKPHPRLHRPNNGFQRTEFNDFICGHCLFFQYVFILRRCEQPAAKYRIGSRNKSCKLPSRLFETKTNSS